MSKILFTWELGEGTGHVTPYVELISRLVSEGHQVHFALRSLHKAHDLFSGSGVTWHQAPFVLPRHVEIIMPVDSYAKVLHHAGYDIPSRLSGLIVAWQNLYAMIDPDLIIFDYSPTAMLAARNSRAKKIAIGTGFHLPPDSRPFPTVENELGQPQNREEVLAFENRVLKIINEALTLIKMEPLTQFKNLLDTDKLILRTLPEFDHYSGRTNANYAGIMKSPPGETPRWPRYPGPKIFAYLKYFETLPNLLEILNQKRYPTLIYGDRLPKDIMEGYFSDTLHFSHKPLDMDAIGKTADVAICNAGHGTSAEMLLSGIPLLLLPLNGEQNLVANNVERLGAGISAPKHHPQAMEHKLDRLINEDSFKDSAQRFCQSYLDHDKSNLTDNLLKTINSFIVE